MSDVNSIEDMTGNTTKTLENEIVDVPPEKESDDAIDVDDDLVADESPTTQAGLGDFPDGWAEAAGPSGRVYYFNSATGGEELNETVGDPELTVSEESKDSTDAPVLAGEPLAPGWTSPEDAIEGRIWYYNTETGETSWEKPTLRENPLLVLLSDMPASGVAGDEQESLQNAISAEGQDQTELCEEPDPPDEKELSPGWTKITDET